ncbi:MAG: transcription-repair coupling factor [Nitrospirae bacterium]|nr:MAG: transcription-repair coupling factor [Nitrospirota bacterium]
MSLAMDKSADNPLTMSVPTTCAQVLSPLRAALSCPSGRAFIVGPHGACLAWVLTLLMHPRQLLSDCPGDPHLTAGHGGPSSWLLLTPTPQDAEQLYQDLHFFYTLYGLPQETLAYFPDRGHAPYEAVPPSTDRIAQRMRALFRLQQHLPTIVVASLETGLQRILPQTVFSRACLSLKPGTVIEREHLLVHLLRLGYRRVSVVDIPGEFAVRGGIIDIFSTAYDDPLRIEFLGDTVESTRLFDPSTQESTMSLSQGWILPAREYVRPSQDLDSAGAGIPNDAEWYCPEIYSPLHTLIEYFPEPSIVVLDRPGQLVKQAKQVWENVVTAWEQSSHHSSAYPPPETLYLHWEDLQPMFKAWTTLACDLHPPGEDKWHPIVSFPVQSPRSVGLGLQGMAFRQTQQTLESLRHKGPVLVVARHHGQAGRLLTLFSEHEAPAVNWEPRFWAPTFAAQTPFFITHGLLSSGFVWDGGRFTIVTEEELFAKSSRLRHPRKSKAATFLSSLDDLNVGDYVVHVHYGISRYQGLRRLSVQGFESDYLILQFAGQDTLYVPLDRLNQIQRYRGAEQHVPKLDRLGSGSWAKTTARVRKNIEDMAKELVQLYASREVIQRRTYREDPLLTHEFEAAFDYEETPDQLRAIEEIRRDMASPKPMDRLVCGDVGYGKTEVAMRAAFTAVQDGRQVAVLVPTTLLAQQHYETFCQRFAAFPVRIGVLSRFQTPRDVKALLADLASGVIDIVIGTHRLLQKDVQFKNLGLVIIDEEQWFGVRHKERLKQLRTHVDVLTLTATPIPRTLQMAFSGVRDLSVIDTPPAGRLAIRTHVLRFDPHVVREAIRRELARGGQTFYVHNRVETMERTAAWLQELVPEARVIMAHGQMPERVLEGVMLRFFHGEADVLVASAIIQSGLDLSRANTILVDRADLFGLAQLYQLRGRVGRAGEQAYAYFFFPNEEVLTTEAQKRLMAIQEFADLGSGFRIAAADLEIRGAGNLLGKQQSGNIAAVGLDLYMKMVEEAVQQLKGQQVEEDYDPTLHLSVSAYIPQEYVEDEHQRLSLYKRLASCQHIGELAVLHGEIQDRYGLLPDPVERLFEVMHIKILAKASGVETVETKPGGISLVFRPNVTLSASGIQWLMDAAQGRLRFLAPRTIELSTTCQDWASLEQELQHVLKGLQQYALSSH